MEYRQQGNIAFQLLVKSQCQEPKVDLAEMLKYPLTPVPYSIGTADGFLAKNEKSKGFKYLMKDTDMATPPPQDQTLLVIEDGNALFHSMTDIPKNFSGICDKLFNMMPHNVDVIFSTDMYKKGSVKAMERVRRGGAEKLLLQGGNTKRPADWKAFLTNDENKQQLVQVMLDTWNKDEYAARLQHREIILISEEKAYRFTSEDGKATIRTPLEVLNSSQEETDTRVIFYTLYGKEMGYKNIKVKTPDSDIFFILLSYISRFDGVSVLFEIGSGNKKKLLDISEIGNAYTQQHREALLGLHA